jgi:hypothetical protein
VEGISLQNSVVPANAKATDWFETGLTAMLRVVDTVRGTLDPSMNSPDRKLALLGEPILVMVARVSVEAAAPTPKLDELATAPNLLVQPPAMPSIQVRIGDITRPDDGVFGIFSYLAGKPVGSTFAPVSQGAADHAVFNGWAAGLPAKPDGLAVQHPFVKSKTIAIVPNSSGPTDLVLLTDIRGALYATCGVLPRKKITIPKQFIDSALRNMEPVFRTGPVLSFKTGATLRPLLPPPQISGYKAEFLYPDPHAKAGVLGATLPPSVPLADLPPGRVSLTEGWIMLEQRKK